MPLLADYHTHTFYSHGKGSPEENVCVAIQKGLKHIAISDHGPAHMFFGVRAEKFHQLRREINGLNQRYCRDISVFMGIECNLMADGDCELSRLDRGLFDLTILAYHKGVWPKGAFARHSALESFGLGQSRPEETAQALLRAAGRYKIDIFSHPSLYTKADMAILGEGAAELGVLLELNAHHMVLSEADIRLAAAQGARFILSSDAHRPEDVGCFDVAITAARQAEVMDRIVETLPRLDS